jgi:hypothetical protein
MADLTPVNDGDLSAPMMLLFVPKDVPSCPVYLGEDPPAPGLTLESVREK